jgi:hypothetical protein
MDPLGPTLVSVVIRYVQLAIAMLLFVQVVFLITISTTIHAVLLAPNLLTFQIIILGPVSIAV